MSRSGIAFLLAAGLCAGAPPASPALLATPDWAHEPASLLLRASADGQGLLLRRAGGAVYRYAATPARLERVAEAVWRGTATAIRDCAAQRPLPVRRQDQDGYVLLLDGGELALDGVPAASAQSPSGRFGAIVSGAAAGRSLFPFLGQGVRGPYRQLLLDLKRGRALEAARPLPFAASLGAVRACWTADEAFIVYHDLYLSQLAIAPVPRTLP